MAGRFSIEAVFKAVDKVTAPVTRMQNRLGKFTRATGRGFDKLNRRMSKFAGGIKKAALASVVAFALIGGAVTDVVAVGADFDRAIGTAAAKFPEKIERGTAAFKALADAARKTGSTTEFTATQSAQALDFLAMAGFRAQEAVGALPGIVDLATIAAVDLGRASDIATDSLGALGLRSKDAAQNQKNLTRINDVFAKTITSANVNVEDLFESLKQGAPVGVAAGQSLETIATLAAKMADAGIKGTRAGTGLKRIFLGLNAPTSGAAKVMRKLGIQTADSEGNIRDAIAVFKDFSKVVNTLPKQTQLKVFDEIFGKIPIAAAINITRAADSMDEFRDSLLGAEGTSKEMAATIRDDVRGSLDSLKSVIEGVKISIFEMNKGPLKELLDNTVAWVRANENVIASGITEFVTNLVDNFEDVVIWAKRIGKAILSFIALKLALSTFVGIMTAVNLAMSLNPVGAIIIGVTALIALVATLAANWDTVKAAFEDFELPEFLQSSFGADFDPDRQAAFNGAGASGDLPQMVSPQARTARSVEEQRSTSTAEVTIKDDTGRAEVTGGALGAGVKLQPSGGF